MLRFFERGVRDGDVFAHGAPSAFSRGVVGPVVSSRVIGLWRGAPAFTRVAVPWAACALSSFCIAPPDTARLGMLRVACYGTCRTLA